jgi:predicted membrane channel-forming protein YqfA (hemolysin III family)
MSALRKLLIYLSIFLINIIINILGSFLFNESPTRSSQIESKRRLKKYFSIYIYIQRLGLF